MPYKQRKNKNNISIYPSSEINLTFDEYTNRETIYALTDDYILIWLDKCINKEDPDDQNSINELRLVINSIAIFTDVEEFYQFIQRFRVAKNKLILVVSGSLGKDVVPIIYSLPHINLVYVFCNNIDDHKCWAKNYEKVKGVFNNVTELCYQLKRYQENVGYVQLIQKFMNPFVKKLSEPNAAKEKLPPDKNQPADDIQSLKKTADIPFDIVENIPEKNDVEINMDLESSCTVTPFVEYKQQMEFSDTGIWPCSYVVDSTINGIFNHLNSVIGTVKFSPSIEDFLQHICSHRIDPHLVILCDLTYIQHLPKLISHRVRKVYIYCPNKLTPAFYALSDRYPNQVSVLQHVETLTRLIIWDLSACIVDIGNYYDSDDQKNMAQVRYRYAYRLHLIMQADLDNRRQIIQHVDSSITDN